MFEGIVMMLFGAAFTAAALFTWWHAAEERLRRDLKALRPTPIREVHQGLVKVRGKVKLLEALRAPLSGRTCAYYEVFVEQTVTPSDSRTIVIHEVEERDFLLEDGTGRARVEMVTVRAAVTKDVQWTQGMLTSPTPELEAFLARHGHVAQGRFSYREGVIEPGEEVAVLGWAEREPDPQSGAIGAAYRAPPLRVVLKGAGELPVKVSDDPTTFD